MGKDCRGVGGRVGLVDMVRRYSSAAPCDTPHLKNKPPGHMEMVYSRKEGSLQSLD